MGQSAVIRDSDLLRGACFARMIFAGVSLLALVVMSPLAEAAINKCIGADGKVVFSDQPCVPGQSASTIQEKGGPKSSATPLAKPAADPNAAMKSMRDRVDAALTPECRRMRKQALEQVLATDNARQTEAELQKIIDDFEAQCSPLIKAAQEAEWAKGKAERDRTQKLGECTEKRRIFAERKGRLQSLTEPDRQATARLGAEIERDCR